MKISDILRSIAATLSKPLAAIKFKTISAESIHSQIEDAKWALSVADAAYNLLSEKQLNMLYTKVLTKLKMDVVVMKSVGRPATDFIVGIDKNLNGRARTVGFINALRATSASMVKMLDTLNDNVDKILSDKDGIVMNDIQVSHGILLGAIESAKIYSSMNSYLLAIFSHVISMAGVNDDSLPRYMSEYIAANGEVYIRLINLMTNTPGSYPVLNKIADIKKRGLDIKLAGTSDAHRHLSGEAIGQDDLLFSIFAILIAPIAWIGEAYVDYRHTYYERLKERKKWLESHVANIKLSLEDADPNDPEYVKTKKVVQFYDDKISEIDKKIAKYESE